MRCRDAAIEQLPRSNVWVMHTGLGNVVLSNQSGRRLTELRDAIVAAEHAEPAEAASLSREGLAA